MTSTRTACDVFRELWLDTAGAPTVNAAGVTSDGRRALIVVATDELADEVAQWLRERYPSGVVQPVDGDGR